jgi:hypothetical protein
MLIALSSPKYSPKGNIQVPPVLVRFARDMGEVLRSSNLLVEFWKHCLNLVQYRVIDAECLKVCMAIAKGNNPWSSAGISTVGLGLAGPIALESSQGVVPPSEDPMDLDGETHDGKPFLKERWKLEIRDFAPAGSHMRDLRWSFVLVR